MKKLWLDTEFKESQLNKFREVKMKRGYVNSLETRKKLSNSSKNLWLNNKITDKQKNTLFKKGYDKRRIKTQFKDKHIVDKKTREAVKLNRSNQVFPKNDTAIELKIQNFLKEMNIDFLTHYYINNIEHAYQCDIFIPRLNLIIECDGNYWHFYPCGTTKDFIRNLELKSKGYNVLRLWEHNIKQMNINEFKKRLEVYN